MARKLNDGCMAVSISNGFDLKSHSNYIIRLSHIGKMLNVEMANAKPQNNIINRNSYFIDRTKRTRIMLNGSMLSMLSVDE